MHLLTLFLLMKKRIKPAVMASLPQPLRQPFCKALVISMVPQFPLAKLAYQAKTSADSGPYLESTTAKVIIDTTINRIKVIAVK